MFRLWRQFGDALDRSGLAGWLLLLCGFGIIGVTLLAPAWLDVRQLEAQVSVLERQHQVLEFTQWFLPWLGRTGLPLVNP